MQVAGTGTHSEQAEERVWCGVRDPEQDEEVVRMWGGSARGVSASVRREHSPVRAS